jgi:hypothetical protein
MDIWNTYWRIWSQLNWLWTGPMVGVCEHSSKSYGSITRNFLMSRVPTALTTMKWKLTMGLFHWKGRGGDLLKNMDESDAGNSGSSNSLPSSRHWSRILTKSCTWPRALNPEPFSPSWNKGHSSALPTAAVI